MKISVIGAGGWGTTISILLHENGNEVSLWEYKKEYADTLKTKRENSLLLPGIKIPEPVYITHDLQECLKNRDMIVLAVPSQFLRSVIEQFNFDDIKNTILVSVAKGIEKNTLLRMTQVIKSVFPKLGDDKIAALSGPSHAEEVSRKVPTTLVAASLSEETAQTVQKTFMNSYLRVYHSTDIIGVELGGSVKNVIAIAAGIIDGAKFGDNTKAAVMTRGIAEISRLGVALGSKAETFAGLSGMGDLIVTCMSRHSRNRYVGEKIGEGKKLKEVIDSMNMVAEGVESSRSVKELAVKAGVETPIVDQVYKILFEDKDPIAATYELMSRDMKSEM